jgi:hypothetical protein
LKNQDEEKNKMEFNLNKRGQVTLFIIIGVVLLIGLFITMQLRGESFKIDEKQTVEITPTGFQSYVEQCLSETSREALFKLGDLGGYLNVPEYISRDDRAVLSMGGLKVPLWYFNGKNREPTLTSMEENLDYYISTNVEKCFNEFKDFEFKYSVDILGEPSVQTIIGDNDITFRLNYDVSLSTLSGNETTEYTDFVITQPVRLKQVFNLAKDIMDAENREFIFERATIDLMSINPNIPLTGTEFTCGPKIWMIEDVERELKNMLFYNLFKTRFRNTDYPSFIAPESYYQQFAGFTAEDISNGNLPPEDKPSDAYEYFNLFFDVTTEDFSDLKASVEFMPQSRFEFRPRPSSNGVMKGNNMQGATQYLSFLCMNFYHFTYDVRYMVRLNVYDPMSLNGDGYKFSFAFPVVIKSNRPDRREDSVTTFDNPVVYSNPCSQYGDEDIEIQAIGLFEGYDGVDLKDVNITYDCIRAGCKLGTTEAVNGQYKLVTKIPTMCSGGFLTATKEGYLPAKVQYAGQDRVSIDMKKTKQFKVKAMKRSMNDLQTDIPLAAYEEVVIHMYSEEDDVNYFNRVGSGEEVVFELAAEDGNYSLNLMLVDNVHDGLWGGYKGNFTYEYEDAASSDTLILNVLEYLPHPITTEQRFEMFQYLEENSEYRDALEPRFD